MRYLWDKAAKDQRNKSKESKGAQQIANAIPVGIFHVFPDVLLLDHYRLSPELQGVFPELSNTWTRLFRVSAT